MHISVCNCDAHFLLLNATLTDDNSHRVSSLHSNSAAIVSTHTEVYYTTLFSHLQILRPADGHSQLSLYQVLFSRECSSRSEMTVEYCYRATVSLLYSTAAQTKHNANKWLSNDDKINSYKTARKSVSYPASFILVFIWLVQPLFSAMQPQKYSLVIFTE